MEHNVYFDGNVQSLSLQTTLGRATIGVITPGRYAFSTSTEERMVVTSGVLTVKLPAQNGKRCRRGRNSLLLPTKPSRLKRSRTRHISAIINRVYTDYN